MHFPFEGRPRVGQRLGRHPAAGQEGVDVTVLGERELPQTGPSGGQVFDAGRGVVRDAQRGVVDDRRA